MNRALPSGTAGACLLTGFLLSATVQASTSAIQDRVLRMTNDAIAVLNDAATHGITTPQRDIEALEAARTDVSIGRSETAWLEDVETRVKEALLSYGLDLSVGRERPSRSRIISMQAAINAAVEAGHTFYWYRARIPTHPEYHRLRAALLVLQETARDAEWPEIGPGPTLQPGDRGERVARLRARLGLPVAEIADFDEQLSSAVFEYQRRHGLEADGRVGRRTREHLDVTVEERLSQLRENLARWRQSDLRVDGRQIRVNLPSYDLEYRDGDGFSSNMRVVIGDLKSPTPLLSDTIEYLVFSPYWDVPDRIARHDILPRQYRDASYISRMRFDVYAKETHRLAPVVDWDRFRRPGSPYFMRQRPGPENSLGRLKFMFPNPDYIYMHDSPATQLFAESRRAYSNGCIRVENAGLLAEWLLEGQADWNAAAIGSAMDGIEPTRVVLEHTTPIVTTYFTVIAHESGEVSFYEDVYGFESGTPPAMASTYLPSRSTSELKSPRVTAN